jgi:hypothetical protein
MLEKDFQRNVINMMKRDFPDLWFFKVSDRFMGGIPDIIGCCRGRMFGIELKVSPNKTTKLQDFTIDLMRKAGARVAVVSDDVDKARLFLLSLYHGEE